MITVRVQRVPFDAGGELAALSSSGVGGIASFIGTVRGDDELATLTLEHYPAMTARALQALAEHAASHWSLAGVTIVHRVGAMVPGDAIVFVGTASAHRAAALESCAFLIDRLKTDAPFWKKEAFASGETRWVDARDNDHNRAARWNQTAAESCITPRNP